MYQRNISIKLKNKNPKDMILLYRKNNSHNILADNIIVPSKINIKTNNEK